MERTTDQPPQLMTLLADPVGWSIVVRLTRSDEHQRALAATLQQPPEKVSDLLATLSEQGLVHQRQSDVSPDDTFYRLDLEALREAFSSIGTAIHPVVGGKDKTTGDELPITKPRVLFLCTGNSARSQIAEGLMRHLSKNRIEVFSAGSQPSQIHPMAIEVMDHVGIDIRQQRSKHLDEFSDQKFDYVITVCDQQREVCPIFPGDPQRLHWSFSDPVAEPHNVQDHAFKSTANQLRQLIRHFLILLEKKEQSA